jgi:hypothetical protein
VNRGYSIAGIAYPIGLNVPAVLADTLLSLERICGHPLVALYHFASEVMIFYLFDLMI